MRIIVPNYGWQSQYELKNSCLINDLFSSSFPIAICQGKKDLTMATRYFRIFTHSNSPMPPPSPLEYCTKPEQFAFYWYVCWSHMLGWRYLLLIHRPVATCRNCPPWSPNGRECRWAWWDWSVCFRSHGTQGRWCWQSLWWEFVVSSLKIFENCPIVKEWEQYLHFGVVGTIKQICVYQEL